MLLCRVRRQGTDDKLRFSIKAKNERDWVVRIGFAGCVLLLLCSAATSATSKSNAAPNARVGHARADRARQKRDDAKRARSLSRNYVLVGAGDIAGCSSLAGAAATAKLIEQIPGTVFAAGDLAYDRGTVEEFSKCYDTTWGKLKDRTRPVPGNHEYYSEGGKPYFKYWGQRAGPTGKGYYSFDLGS